MDSSDDIVIRPSLTPRHRPGARTRAAIARRLSAHQGKGGWLWKVARLRAMRAAGRVVEMARSEVAGGMVGEVLSAGGKAAGSVAGTVAMGVLVAGVAALRLASGKPLAGTGEAINRMILGDLDDDARAAMEVRTKLQGNENIARVVGQEGRINSQVRKIADDLREFERRKQHGESMMREEFASNGWLDMLIVRGRDAAVSAFQSAGGDASVERIRGGLDRIHMGYNARKAASR